MGLRSAIIDAWGKYNYKPLFADSIRGMPNRRVFPEAAATWVPADDERRLAAYKLLAAYDNNQAGELAEIQDGPTARERREYGDPSMFVDTVMSHVLGREQTITVPGAENADTDRTAPEAELAARVQELLRDWAESELLALRIQQSERKAVSLGDGVYRLAWDRGRMRPTLRVHDPGFYFPVLPEDGDAGDFPTRVHFAWELPEDPKRGLKTRLRRITYELDWIMPATASGVDDRGRQVRAPLPVQPGEDGELPPPPLTPGDMLNPDTGAISRLYAWNQGEPSFVTCYLTDATWEIGDLKGGNLDVDNLPLDAAQFATRGDGETLDRLDLLIDFIPVVHVPNTVPAAEEHWGESSLGRILQAFDSLAWSDTDSSRASATTGLPMVGISGVTDPRATYTMEPGAVFKLGENGRLTAVNTAPQLAELRNHVHDLHDRASTIARLPAVALGTIDPSQVPSGYALQLSLGPLDALISSMRLARDSKYALLLKFVQRLYLAGQHPDWAGVTVQPARLMFGSSTPTDKQAVLEQVTLGVEKGVMSLETGVRMLVEAGFPIDDATEEIERIESRQFEKARALADALGNVDEVASFLGRKAPDEIDPPAPQLPQLPDVTGTNEVEEDLEGEDGTASTSENSASGESRGNTR